MRSKEMILKSLDGVDSTANVLSLINPVFAGITMITFVIKMIIGYTDSNDIVERIYKIEKQLNNNKIDLAQFKEKVLALSKHDVYVAKNNLINIITTCIPENVDLYISVWIDFIMNENNSIHEEMCEILKDLNQNDVILLEMIKSFNKYAEKRYYISSELSRNKRIEEQNKEVLETKEYNSKTKGIKKPEFYFIDRDFRIGDKTIFWKDFSKHYLVNAQELGHMILFKGTNEKDEEVMDWAYITRSFIKLDRLGIIQLEYYSTIHILNSMNIDRFHITLFGEKLLEYIPLKRRINFIKKD